MISIRYDVDNFYLVAGDFEESFNPDIFKVTGVEDTPEIRKTILELHGERHRIFNGARLTDESEVEALKYWAEQLTEVENKLQEAWGFGANPDYHTYWHRLPKCKCPSMDNAQWWGTSLRAISESCPIHGVDSAQQ